MPIELELIMKLSAPLNKVNPGVHHALTR